MAGAVDLPADKFLSLNLSPPTLEAPSEFSAVALLGILARHGLPPHRLAVELTGPPAVRIEIDARHDAIGLPQAR